MTNSGYSINGYRWILHWCILVLINAYYINGYQWLFYCVYWWLLIVIILVDISGYSIVDIGGY